MKKRIRQTTTLALALAGTLFAGALRAETLRYAGSDFLAGKTEAELAAEVRKNAPGTEIRGELIGSMTALDELRAGKIDFALLLLKNPDEIPEIKSGKWRARTVAYHVSYIVAPQSNPVEELSLFQLRGIFADFAEKPLASWSEVPGAGAFSAKIDRVVSTQNDNFALATFQSLVFPRTRFNAALRKTKTDEDALRAVSNSGGAIALVSAPPTGRPDLKTLAVSPADAAGKSATAYRPIPSNIYNRDYPLSIQFFVVYPAENAEKVAPVLETAFSDAFAESLEKSSLMPVPKNIRKMFKKNVDGNGK